MVRKFIFTDLTKYCRAQSKEDQIQKYFGGADFGYVRERRHELQTYSRATLKTCETARRTKKRLRSASIRLKL